MAPRFPRLPQTKVDLELVLYHRLTSVSEASVVNEGPQLEHDTSMKSHLTPLVVIAAVGLAAALFSGTNCIKIGLAGKLIPRKRKGLREVIFCNNTI